MKYSLLFVILALAAYATPSFAQMVTLKTASGEFGSKPADIKITFESLPGAPYPGAWHFAGYMQIVLETDASISGIDAGYEAEITETYNYYNGSSVQNQSYTGHLKLECTNLSYCIGGFGPRTNFKLGHPSFPELHHQLRIKNLKDGSYLKFEDGSTDIHLILPAN